MKLKFRKLFIKLPSKILFIIIFFYRKFCSLNDLIKSHKKLKYLSREALRIKVGLASRINSNILVIYDNNISPPAHGDFMNMYMLARFFSFKGYSTSFIIIKQENNFWDNFSENARNKFKDFQNKCFSSFGSLNISIYNYSWNDFINRQCLNNDEIIIFEENVFNRYPIVKDAFNLLNVLTQKENHNNLNNWRLKPFPTYKCEFFPNLNYLTWNIRYSNVLPELNNTEYQIIEIYNFLSKKFPKLKILILSDIIGTSFIKKIAKEYNLELYYSKDIIGNDSYIDDAKLMLSSEFYFQLSGGGMSTIAFFSNRPYLIYQKPSYEKESFRLGLNWALKNQKFILLNHWSPIEIKNILYSK